MSLESCKARLAAESLLGSYTRKQRAHNDYDKKEKHRLKKHLLTPPGGSRNVGSFARPAPDEQARK